ncbi:hypothetical protein [Spirosoma sp.]|uniref:hypothetical protein n=1 Tax=Spirosoma sp. TaxID=1899569 RepID=UPI0026250861|nr:hypothetical protein [Spirosoma sp.]MCX6214782.1 hypothetical protein [Spirosoma sp.]
MKKLIILLLSIVAIACQPTKPLTQNKKTSLLGGRGGEGGKGAAENGQPGKDGKSGIRIENK